MGINNRDFVHDSNDDFITIRRTVMDELDKQIEDAKEKFKDGIYCEADGVRTLCTTREQYLDWINKEGVGLDLQAMLIVSGLPSENDNNLEE